MISQIWRLSKLQLCNLLGWNEMRYTKDKSKKRKFVFMACVWVFLALILVSYVAILSMGFIGMGIGNLVPMYLFLVTSMIILLFTFFKASGIIFQMNSYEILLSLPFTNTAIVVSRFLSMYISNLVLSILVMGPGLMVCFLLAKASAASYIMGFIGTLFLPMLPITLATAVGALITAVSSRMKRKSLVSSILTIGVFTVIILASFGSSSVELTVTQDSMKNLIADFSEKVQHTYAPAVWFQKAVTQGAFLNFLLLIAVSVIVFFVFVAVLQKYFNRVCSWINSTSAKNNYTMGSLSKSSLVKALWKREWRRYFSSSVYVVNTILGYVFMVVIAVAVCIFGAEKAGEMMNFPGKVEVSFPFLLALTAGLMPTTTCSVSLEGKNWWIMKTLPVPAKELFTGKILLNLSVAAPFYLVSVILGIIAIHGSVMQVVLILLVPVVYMLFTSIIGLFINLKMPVLQWDNEANVVKQGGSTIVTMLINSILGGIPCILLLVAEGQLQAIVSIVFCALSVIGSYIVWKLICRINILHMG